MGDTMEELRRAQHQKDAKCLERRKHRKSKCIAISPDGEHSTWRGLIYGNEWLMSHNQVKALLRNGARKPV